MNTTSLQYRGNCQVCGRLQAVVSGRVAKHGYTVKHGWFDGICSGQHHAPMQTDTAKTAEIVSYIRWDCKTLDEKVEALEAGVAHPASIPSNIPRRAPTPWREATEWERRDAVRSAIYNAKRRAELGRRCADDLEALAAARLGTALVEVPRDVAPPPVCIGEHRRDETGTLLEATEIRGPRVYWKAEFDGKTRKGWTGSAAWRRLAKE